MFQIKLSETTAARRRIPILLVDATDGYTPETGITSPTIKISKNGAIQATGTGTFTEIGTGQYYYEFASGEVDTLGWIAFNLQKTGTTRDYNAIVQIMAYDAMDVVRLGLTTLPNVAQGTAGSLPTANASGQVTVGTNNDKTGYSLSAGSITFSTFGSGAITNSVLASGAISNSTFASNAIGTSTIASGAITSSSFGADAITASALATDAVNEIADAVWDETLSTHTTAGTFGGRILRATNSNVEVQVTGSNHVAADIHEFQPAVITSADFAAGAINANALATDAVNEIADGVWDEVLSGHLTAGTTGKALSDASTGGGGGGGTTFVTGNLPYVLKADDRFPGGTVDVVVGTLLRLDLQLVDRDDNPINLTGGTVTVGVRNVSTGATVGTDQSATLSFARLGYLYVDTVAAWTASAGTYRITVSATLGSDVIVAGPLQLIVRSR